MLNILIKIRNRNNTAIRKNGYRLIALEQKNLVYTFSTSQQKPQMNKESINEERIKKQQEI